MVDATMLPVALVSWFLWTLSLRPVEVAVLFLAWAGLWIWWKRATGNLVVSLVCLVVLVNMLWGPRAHPAFGSARDCLTERAVAQLAEADPELRWYEREKRDGGRCGLMRYDAAITAQAFLVDSANAAGYTSRTTAVWFTGMGPPNLDPFGGRGFVYSPEGEPYCAPGAVGDVHRCDRQSLGAHWYYYRYSGNLN